MYLPFGRFNAHKTLGRVADFCLFCRGFRPFRVLQVESVLHLFYIPLGGRVGVSTSKVCELCGLHGAASMDRYRSLSSDPDADLESLIAETNPEIRRNWASRLLLEERIAARKLTPGERAELLRELFDMASEVLTQRSLDGKLDLPSNLGCLATFLLPAACLALLPLVWRAPGDAIELVTVIVGGVCVVFTFFALVTDARRHARRAILPRLVDSLRPLDPSADEIDQILESLRHARAPLAEVIHPRDLTNGLLERWE
jgi:hypothetical protein